MNLRGKKGSGILDTIMVMIVLFAFAIVAIFSGYILNDINTDIQANPDMNNESKEVLDDMNTNFTSWFDNGFLFMFILLWILVLVASFMVDSHPIFFIVTVLIFAFVLFTGAIISNTFEEVTEDPEMLTESSQYTKMNFIFTHFVAFLIAIAFSVAFVMFAKTKAG